MIENIKSMFFKLNDETRTKALNQLIVEFLIFVKGPQKARPDVPVKARLAQVLPWVKGTVAHLAQEPPGPFMVHLQKVTLYADAHRNPDI